MKRTLLTSALAVMALAASAQVSEVTKVKGDGFYFMPKTQSTAGVITPYSTIGVDYHSGEDNKSEFTIYDASFNVEKTFSYDRKEFKYNRIPMKALADFTIKKVLDKRMEDAVREFATPITTMDEFKKAILNGNEDAKITFFTDHNGNFAYHEGDDWQVYTTEWDDNGMVPAVRETYYYYNSSDNKLYWVVGLTMSIDVNLANLDWQVDDSRKSREETLKESVGETEVYDYDANCNEDSYGYLSQNVFNNDDKYEFLVYTYRPTSAPTDNNMTVDNGLNVNGIENGKLVINKEVQDKYYESYTSVKNEDGKELFTLPDSDKGSSIYRANGKTYIKDYESLGNGEGQYVIYLLDSTGTGITELARTNAVKSTKTFNMAGMQVGKNAKGIVIQQGGKKYINK